MADERNYSYNYANLNNKNEVKMGCFLIPLKSLKYYISKI